jgi:hypothetical protein
VVKLHGALASHELKAIQSMFRAMRACYRCKEMVGMLAGPASLHTVPTLTVYLVGARFCR